MSTHSCCCLSSSCFFPCGFSSVRVCPLVPSSGRVRRPDGAVRTLRGTPMVLRKSEQRHGATSQRWRLSYSILYASKENSKERCKKKKKEKEEKRKRKNTSGKARKTCSPKKTVATTNKKKKSSPSKVLINSLGARPDIFRRERKRICDIYAKSKAHFILLEKAMKDTLEEFSEIRLLMAKAAKGMQRIHRVCRCQSHF